MDQSHPYLITLLAALLGIPMLIAIARKRERKNRDAWRTLERGQRRRNIAEYRTWQWLYGKPRAPRITDQRPPKGPGFTP